MKSQIALTCAILCLLTLIALSFSLTSVSGEMVARAGAEEVAAPPTIVEAESCLSDDRCSTDGIWHEWYLEGLCSGNYCIINEDPPGSGSPVTATLTLPDVQGTGIGILYRQDLWYGRLGVRIDDQPDYCIQQKGVVEHQAEACFELDGKEPVTLTLFLTGTDKTEIITGVISADAMRIYDVDEPCGTQKSLCNRGIIVPAYFTPTAPLTAPPGSKYWDRLADAARIRGDRLTVIANVNSGPGGPDDLDYTQVISTVISSGGKVIGYVHTCYANQSPKDVGRFECWRRIHDILDDIDRWHEFYPMIDGIFFDEVSMKQEDVSYYQALHYYVQWRHPGAMIVNNFGGEPHEDYLGIDSSILCTYEGPSACVVGWSAPDWLPRDRSCGIIYNTGPDLTAALGLVSRKDIGWFYVTTDVNGYANPYDTLPNYFEELVDAVSCTVYLPIVLKGWP